MAPPVFRLEKPQQHGGFNGIIIGKKPLEMEGSEWDHQRTITDGFSKASHRTDDLWKPRIVR
jgi:hypothetical protein